ncbi:MAG TPA: DUF87 domain-containing protein [Candidatus Scybalousia intestinigallinarum]|nr:DUF87 domain-containing protein [Candidatus Scybalousia intestinigallinarum]
MFDKIIFIGEQDAHIKLLDNVKVETDIMNMPLVLEDPEKSILAEVKDLQDGAVKVRLLGEIKNGKFIGGVLRKPSLNARIRALEVNEFTLIVGEEKIGALELGVSPFYAGKKIYADMNELFSNHMCIFGNTGSGKSCGVARVIQNIFTNPNFVPYRSNFLIFDSSGEYYTAFENLNQINPNYHYRFLTTNVNSVHHGEILKIPLWLLNIEDIALLLSATTHTQISIIEKMMKLVRIFSQSDALAIRYKNHLIASAIMTIMYSNQGSASKRDEIFSIFNTCSTNEFNLNAVVQGIGYTRKLHECFLIDSTDQFSERVLLTEYVNKFIDPELNKFEPDKQHYFTLPDLEKALNFTLISEGWLRNENVYADAITLKVKLHDLVIGSNAKFFDYKEFVRLDQFLGSLIVQDNKKFQIVNINLEDVDDAFAKSIVKIFARLLMEFSKKIERGSMPFNILLEEAHRYVKKDQDEFLFGYNIFDRIAKEGRKYGIIISLISQRPVDISETVISQCSNFLIFKMSHPRDIEYITKMIPNITEDTIEKQKSLQVGNCLGFGSAFKIPLIIQLDMPNPMPQSSSCDVVTRWTNR